MKKVLSIVLALCMLFCLFAGCGNQKTNEPSSTVPSSSEQPEAAEEAIANNDDSLLSEEANNDYSVDKIVQLEASPANLDPTAMNNQGMTFLWEIYEMLYQLDGFGGEMVPVLADGTKGNFKPGMDHEDGSNEYIVYLRDGIIDQAGNKITAADAAFSYNLIINSGNARGMKLFQSAEAVDELSLKLTFQRELNLVGELTTFFARVFIMSEKAYNDSATGFVADACGTGPYKLKDFVSGSKMVLEKNENYWCPADKITCQIQMANVQTIEYVYATETASQIVALETGAANMDANLSLADAADFQDGGSYSDKFDVYTFWDNLTYCLLPNCHKDALTGDINMRLAIFNAVSVEAITAGLAADVPGSYRECYGMGNPNFPDFSENWATWDNYQTNSSADKVKEYLKAAGYNGETVKIISMSGDMETIATMIVGILDQYGVKAEITLVDRTTQNSIKADPTQWDISVESWASSDFVVNMWDKLWKSKNDQGFISESGQFITDDTFLDMCLKVKTFDGHTQENVDAVQKYIIENAYAMGLTQKCSILIYPTFVKTLYLTDKNSVIVGACSYNEK